MTAHQIQLVKESWGFVIVKSDEAGQLFYSRLFSEAPYLKPLFKADAKDQSRKLMSMVTYIVAKLDKLETIMAEVKSLAVRHNKYGAKPEHYLVVSECLLWMLKTGLGDRWTAPTEDAWRTVLRSISSSMIESQEAALA
jgi:hemoglobin-like flavoprotein